jgi:hypothetical protein
MAWGTYLRTFTSAIGSALVGAGSKSARIEQSAAGIATTECITITAMIKSTLAARHRMMATGMITALSSAPVRACPCRLRLAQDQD